MGVVGRSLGLLVGSRVEGRVGGCKDAWERCDIGVVVVEGRRRIVRDRVVVLVEVVGRGNLGSSKKGRSLAPVLA